jgi:hypothetical protein
MAKKCPSPLESKVGIHSAAGEDRSWLMAHMVKCVKMGREMEGLDEPPFDGELGQKIYNNVSKLAW